MDVARLNMSHGDYADHLRNLRGVREAAENAGARSVCWLIFRVKDPARSVCQRQGEAARRR